MRETLPRGRGGRKQEQHMPRRSAFRVGVVKAGNVFLQLFTDTIPPSGPNRPPRSFGLSEGGSWGDLC